jgi:arylsulfatase
VTSNSYWDWYLHQAYMIMAARGLGSNFRGSFKEFPPRQNAASFTIVQSLEKMETALSGTGH